jgi:hypothetical protein
MSIIQDILRAEERGFSTAITLALSFLNYRWLLYEIIGSNTMAPLTAASAPNAAGS